MTGIELPRYRDLPRTAEGVGSAWGLFGADDSIGLMNLVTEEKAIEAARLVRSGRVFALNHPLDLMTPPLFGRGAPTHTVRGNSWTVDDGPTRGLDDKIDNLYPQASTQWDSLGHVGYDVDRYWNGRSTREVRAGGGTIDHVAERGIVTRGVLLDVADRVAELGGPGESVSVTVDDLEAARARAGVEIRRGDVLVVRTGFVEWYLEQPAEVRDRLADPDRITATGIAHGEDMAEYLWDLHIAALGSDAAAAEMFPTSRAPGSTPFDFMHRVLIGQFGMMLGELWRLGPLARDCAADGVYDFMLMSAPLYVPQGIGSPANALAVK